MEYNGFNIVSKGTFPSKVIKRIGKGAVPKTLLGDYTSVGEARTAIDRYSPAKASEKANDKTGNTARNK